MKPERAVCRICHWDGPASQFVRVRRSSGWKVGNVCKACNSARTSEGVRKARYRRWTAEQIANEIARHEIIIGDLTAELEGRR